MPDALTDAASIEIKDAIYVSATRQLRIQTEAADILGRESILITGTKTKISGEVWRLFNRAIPALRFRTAMKASDMIRAALTFPLSMTDLVTKTIMHLPEILRPTVISLAEDEPATAIRDINVFLDTFKMPTIGVYLENSTVQYDLRRFQKNTLIVDADLGDISDDVVRDFLIHMAAPRPVLRLRLYTEGIGVPESHHRQIWHQHNGKLGRTRHPEIYTGLILVDVAAGFIGRTIRHPALYPCASGAGAYRAGRTTTPIALLRESGGLAICGRHGGIVPLVSRDI